MSRHKIKFGIIGCGLMGREFASAAGRWCHLLDITAEPQIVAVCDQNAAAMEWFTQNVPTVAQATADYKELLRNKNVEAVYVAVPHNLHRQIYCDVIEAGKHLLGEKPFGMDKEANTAIRQAAARHPQAVVRGTSQFPYFPACQRIIKFAFEKRFGQILEVEAGFLHSSDLNPDKPINWKRMVKINGAYGCMGDLGMHTLHVPLRLGWAPQNVRAILSKIVSQRPDGKGGMAPCETWDNATLFCEVQTGGDHFPLTLKTQRIAPGETNTWYFTVKGTRLSARFSTKHPKTLETMPYDPARPQGWLQEDLGYESVYKTITGSIFEFGFTDAILQMLAAYCEQVAKGPAAEVPFGCVTLEETRLQHELFTAALESHREQIVVALG